MVILGKWLNAAIVAKVLAFCRTARLCNKVEPSKYSSIRGRYLSDEENNVTTEPYIYNVVNHDKQK